MNLPNLSTEQSDWITLNYKSLSCDNIIVFLNTVFQGTWTYSIKNLITNEYNASLNIVVELTTPIKIIDGVAFENLDFTKDTVTLALNKAIYNAFNNSITGLVQSAPETSAQPVAKYTEEQKQFIVGLYAKYNIQNDEQFLAYLKTWDKSITAIAQLNPQNINNFIDYMKKLEGVKII